MMFASSAIFADEYEQAEDEMKSYNQSPRGILPEYCTIISVAYYIAIQHPTLMWTG